LAASLLLLVSIPKLVRVQAHNLVLSGTRAVGARTA